MTEQPAGQTGRRPRGALQALDHPQELGAYFVRMEPSALASSTRLKQQLATRRGRGISYVTSQFPLLGPPFGADAPTARLTMNRAWPTRPSYIRSVGLT